MEDSGLVRRKAVSISGSATLAAARSCQLVFKGDQHLIQMGWPQSKNQPQNTPTVAGFSQTSQPSYRAPACASPRSLSTDQPVDVTEADDTPNGYGPNGKPAIFALATMDYSTGSQSWYLPGILSASLRWTTSGLLQSPTGNGVSAYWLW